MRWLPSWIASSLALPLAAKLFWLTPAAGDDSGGAIAPTAVDVTLLPTFRRSSAGSAAWVSSWASSSASVLELPTSKFSVGRILQERGRLRGLAGNRPLRGVVQRQARPSVLASGGATVIMYGSRPA